MTPEVPLYFGESVHVGRHAYRFLGYKKTHAGNVKEVLADERCYRLFLREFRRMEREAKADRKLERESARALKARKTRKAAYIKEWRKNSLRAKASEAARNGRRRALKKALSPELSREERGVVRTMYETSKRLSACTGIRFEVDHIVPLKPREGAPGLHVPQNLQVLPMKVNRTKHNKPIQAT